MATTTTHWTASVVSTLNQVTGNVKKLFLRETFTPEDGDTDRTLTVTGIVAVGATLALVWWYRNH